MTDAVLTALIRAEEATMTPMRVIVCGGRDYDDRDHVRFVLAVWPIHDSAMPTGYKGIRFDLRDAAKANALTIVHGACPTGLDALAGDCALSLGYEVEPHPANWYGPCRDTCSHRPRGHNGRCPAAGPYRNQEMADAGADLCVKFPGGHGTDDMAMRAVEAGIPVYHA